MEPINKQLSATAGLAKRQRLNVDGVEQTIQLANNSYSKRKLQITSPTATEVRMIRRAVMMADAVVATVAETA